MKRLVLSAVAFVVVFLLAAGLAIAAWLGASFRIGGNAEGAFGVSPFLAILFIPLLVVALGLGIFAGRWVYRRERPDVPDPATAQRIAAALLDALAQYHDTGSSRAHCPACSSRILVAPAATAGRVTARCDCNAVGGEYHAPVRR